MRSFVSFSRCKRSITFSKCNQLRKETETDEHDTDGTADD
jgi:hypothetical protein